ncbi:hypothetical protein GGR52DRAFT_580835 [Hypoxylon sp. FL1284]|nr:hypothetical protein GGR52DRAFT_580835 [Hypoxylon sp. FL1284]
MPTPLQVSSDLEHDRPPTSYGQPASTDSCPPETALPAAHHYQPYPPIQVPSRQPLPFPAHPYGQRESVVKDPDEKSFPQLPSQNSISNGIISMHHVLPVPHGAHYPNWQQENNLQRPMSFGNGHNGHSMLPSPTIPPPPMPVGQHPPNGERRVCEQPALIDPKTQALTSAKRKAQRVSQACDSCRQLKAKCDEIKPCSTCRDKNTECRYRDPPAKQPEKGTEDILRLLTILENDVLSMKRDLVNVINVVENIAPTVVETPLSLGAAQEILRSMDKEDREDQPGPPVMPGKPAMPLNHTTMANLLLKWPSIYSMQLRGMLRVFGKGEGSNAGVRDANNATNRDHTMTEAGERYSDGASSMLTGEVWGQVGGLIPPHSNECKGGVWNNGKKPDFDPAKVWAYVQSFKDNILIMHPIIIPRELNAIVTIFLHDLSQPTDNSSTPASFAKQNMKGYTLPSVPKGGLKRKRSSSGGEDIPNTHSSKIPMRLFRSVDHALVLLVLALGEICLYRDKIPDVVRDPEAPSYGYPSMRNDILTSPSQRSPPVVVSHYLSSGLRSPEESGRGPVNQRLLHRTPPDQRNMDVIPGLKYFALATDIIGSHLTGFELKHVWMHILAGLYYGQLGRVMESWSYISSACRTLQVILRPSLGRLSSRHDLEQHKRDNQLAFAFWTCLQLESDILAELSLPQSGILQYESQMPYPNTSFAVNHGFELPVVESYLAQLYLRKQLNQVHSLLYNPEHGTEQALLEETINKIQVMLKGSRGTWVPPTYAWNDGDPLATDILRARLRAKYWGSQVILYRPFLKMILNHETPPSALYHAQPAPAAIWDSLGLELTSQSVPPQSDPRTMNYACLAIQALVESTQAFHGMDSSRRIIISNVFGTAHAQWGNLLTLAACYRDEFLNRYVDAEILRNLFTRTIAFFQMIAYPSSVLTVEMNILIGLAHGFGFRKTKTA